jgi:hypothetical protein
MSQVLREFLANRLTLPVLAAWGARIAGSEFVSLSKYEWLTTERLEQTHQELTLAAERLGRHNLRPSRLCWVFEHLRIYFAARSDGASLACYVQNSPEIAVGEVEKVLDDFVTS